MNNSQVATLEAIFRTPTPANIRWTAIESLLEGLGATIQERAGSRVAVIFNGRVQVFHRPHPKPDTGRATVRDVRDFLESVGVRL